MSQGKADDDEDVFGGLIDFEKENYAIGYQNGEVEALERSKVKSVEEGASYGESIGNHMGYYSTSIKILMEMMPEQFSEKNSRVFRLVEKLRKKISEVNIQECYED